MAGKAARMRARHDGMVEWVRAHGETSVGELASGFGVSVATARRDLALLEEAGRLVRTHGGALLSKTGVVEFAFAERSERLAEEKRAIAQRVASMVHSGATVALDSGTTTLEVAKALAGLDGLTVLTSSLAIASVLYAYETIELVFLGGTARKGSPDLTGWLTEENLKQFHVDFSVVGADGITRDGAYARAVDLARVCRSVLAAGETSILVVDHSKVGRASFSRFASLRQFDHVVTDGGVPRGERKWLERMGRDVSYVEACGRHGRRGRRRGR